MIEEIEKFAADLQFRPFPQRRQRKALEDAEIHVRRSWRSQYVAAGVAIEILSRRIEGVLIEPVVDGALIARQISIAQHTWPCVPGIGAAHAELRRERLAGTNGDDCVGLPATGNSVQQWI